jgi:hypothetical protein
MLKKSHMQCYTIEFQREKYVTYNSSKISFCLSDVLKYFRTTNATFYSMEISVHKNKLLPRHTKALP